MFRSIRVESRFLQDRYYDSSVETSGTQLYFSICVYREARQLHKCDELPLTTLNDLCGGITNLNRLGICKLFLTCKHVIIPQYSDTNITIIQCYVPNVS